MSLFAVLKRFMRYLDKQGVEYQFLNHPAGRSSLDVMRDMGYEKNALAEAVLLEDSLGERMLVYPATDRPDPAMINKKFRRNFKLLGSDEIHRRYPDCPAGFCVPLADIYNLDAYIDRRLADFDAVYFSLDERTLCRIRGDDFRAIQRKAIWYEPARSRRSSVTTTVAGKVDVAKLAEEIKPVRSAVARKPAKASIPVAKSKSSTTQQKDITPRSIIKKKSAVKSKSARAGSSAAKSTAAQARSVSATQPVVKTKSATKVKAATVRPVAKAVVNEASTSKASATSTRSQKSGPRSSSSVEQRRKKIRARLQKLDSLPAMPKMASEIIQISSNPYANSHDLAAVIEQDPSLAAQLMRYAKSSFYGYRGEIDSLHQAISRVLGFDMVMDMALGIALGKSFRIPANGTLGLKAFWQHAVYSAMLVQRLSAVVKSVHRPRPGQAYLAGLLQNIGLLALGQLFPEEFAMLNKAVNKYPDVPLSALEEKVLGVTHAEVGSWLMEAWDMPGELLIAVREHHDPEYCDSHATYANLALISNRLLSTIDVGDELNDELPDSILTRLGMDSATVLGIFEKLLKDRAGLDYMAVQMAA
ncbi:MAG TPA: HDOD domain-containing protein [Gammaproteobacteria bacterium]|nr:HDOD domain-containing protein [Gammaproteobacteria bacterium]